MFTVIVLSDTHGNIKAINDIKSEFLTAEKVIHLGDRISDMDSFKNELSDKFIAVKGNCDLGGEELIAFLNGVKTLIVHGNIYKVKTSLTKLYLRAKEVNAELVLYGHTHKADITMEDGITFINPGCMTKLANKSYCKINIEKGSINAKIIGVN